MSNNSPPAAVAPVLPSSSLHTYTAHHTLIHNTYTHPHVMYRCVCCCRAPATAARASSCAALLCAPTPPTTPLSVMSRGTSSWWSPTTTRCGHGPRWDGWMDGCVCVCAWLCRACGCMCVCVCTLGVRGSCSLRAHTRTLPSHVHSRSPWTLSACDCPQPRLPHSHTISHSIKNNNRST